MAARRTLGGLSRLRPVSPAACLRTEHVADSRVMQQTPQGASGVGCPQYLTVRRTVSTSVTPAGPPVGAALTYTGRVLLHGIHDLPYEPQVLLCPPACHPYITLSGCCYAASWPCHPSRPCRCMADGSHACIPAWSYRYRPLRMLDCYCFVEPRTRKGAWALPDDV